MLYVGRFFAGVGTGAICVCAPMYIGEIAHSSIRGTLAAFFQMFLCSGILLTCCLASFSNWILLSGILTIVPILFLASFFFMPETPVYSIKIGDIKQARYDLRYFRGSTYNVEAELRDTQNDITESLGKKAGLKDLMGSRANRRALIAALGVMAFQQLSGINAVIFYTEAIFESAGSLLSPNVAAILITLVQVIVSYVDLLIMEKANRRFYLIMSSSGMFICLAALGMYLHFQSLNLSSTSLAMVPLISLVLFVVCFSVGFGPVPWMLMAELFPPEIKGIASGLAVLVNWSSAFLITFSFPVIKLHFGEHVAFYSIAAVNAFATIFTYFGVPETRGKSLQEIQEVLNN